MTVDELIARLTELRAGGVAGYTAVVVADGSGQWAIGRGGVVADGGDDETDAAVVIDLTA